MALNLRWNLVSTQYLENYMTYFHGIYICIHIDKIQIGFFGNCTRVMALYLCQNFVSAQYLENIGRIHQILFMHSSLQDLAWDCYTSFFANLYQSYVPWFNLKFSFRSISWEPTDIFSPNFIYAFIWLWSSLGLLHIIFRNFVPELWPLIYAKMLFPFNILRTNGQNFTKFYICIHIDKI